MANETRGIAIEAWTQETLNHLSTLHISAATVARPLSRPAHPSSRLTRGAGVSLDIPLDAEHPPHEPHRRGAENSGNGNGNASDGEAAIRAAAFARRREPMRRDSQKRREALLKGKEGSRRRQRWENDRLLGNPHVVPPEPHDWAPQPTYPVHAVPYYLAPLWDERKAHAELARAERARFEARTNDTQRVPRELRERVKRSGAARGLLQRLEEQVREFVRAWVEGKREWEREGVEVVEEDGWTDAAGVAVAESSSSSGEEEDDEIVFVGRNGGMSEVKISAAGGVADDDEKKKQKKKKRAAKDERLKRDKLVFDGLVDDHGASFGRFLVHSIAAYYNLRTWSVTTGNPARREAYVGIPDGHDVLPLGCPESAQVASSTACQLPRPLWVMV